MAGVRFPAWEIFFSIFVSNCSTFFLGTVVAETTKTDGAISDENYDSPELKILDSILKKAQKIKLSDEVIMLLVFVSKLNYSLS